MNDLTLIVSGCA